MLSGILLYFRPLARKSAKTLLKAGSNAIKEGAAVKDVFSATLKNTISTFYAATAKQVASWLTKKPTKPLPYGPMVEKVKTVPDVTDEPLKCSGLYLPRMRMHVAV